MPLYPSTKGLLARAGDYEPLRAFSQGGCYWDKAPQQLIRESPLAEFLPPVEVEKDHDGKYGRFHLESGSRELLSRSKPLGARGIPPDQLRRLKQAIEDFKQKGQDPGAQPQNRELIERFRLPDLKLEPELYRLVGSWWNHRLQILWGCERTRDSSLPPAAAIEKLTEDPFYNFRRLLAGLLLLLLLLLPLGWLTSNWAVVSTWLAQTTRSPQPVSTNLTPDLKPAAAAQRAQTNAVRAEAEAQKAQADAAKARAAADLARQNANQSKSDDVAKAKQADSAEAAAKKAEDGAKQARDTADKAKADAIAAQKAANQPAPGTGATPSPPRIPPVAQLPPAGLPQSQALKTPSSGTGAPQTSGNPPSRPNGAPGNPQLPAGAAPNPTPSTPGSTAPASPPATSANPSPPSNPQPSSSPSCQIVLCDQGQPASDGTMAVALEVRTAGNDPRTVPVLTWSYDGKSVASKTRLEANLNSGDHLIRATILDASGSPAEIQGVLTVEPGKVITTPGKVSLRPKQNP